MKTTLDQKLDRLSEGVLCNFRIGFWGARSQYDKSKLGDNVPKEIVRAVQDLLDDKTLIDDIKNIQWQAKYLLKSNSMAFPIDSVFFIPKKKIVFLDERLKELCTEHDNRVDKLLANFDKLISKFAKRYPDDYDPKKYPSKKDLKDKFYIDYKFFSIGAPDSASKVLDPQEYKRVSEKFKGMVEEMEYMAVNVIANELFERLEKLKNQCESGEGLHGKTVGSINRFLEKWQELWSGNVDDQRLKITISRLRKEMSKVTIERLKGNEEFRNQFAGKLGIIINKIEKVPNISLKRKLDI